jgi:hypothetical protein
MGKYSDFDRIPQDSYQTPERGVLYLLPHLHGIRTFAEPCVGEGQLKTALEKHRRICTHAADIKTGTDALTDPLLETGRFDAIITNPPWTRDIMHDMIRRFMMIAPTWLLFDSNWAFNVESAPLIKHCSLIVPVGRLKWFPDSEFTGKENCAWYRFHIQHTTGPLLMPRISIPAERRKKAEKVEEEELADAA